MDITKFTSYRDKIVKSCSKVIVGKDDAIELVLTCFICSGHVLLEDVPGTGKTMLLRSFAKTIGSAFKRIQFTPDLLPSDLTGINFYNQHTGQFEFRRGPLFANIILADEINRATPRTQSSLLEAMEEKQISVDGSTMPLSEPFMVMATQNPIESYGTFPLPEAQTDRFFMRLKLGYMTREQELSVISRASTTDIIESLETAVTPEETQYLKENFRNVKVHDSVAGYMMDIIEGTRKDSAFVTGVSTRGAIALYKASQVTAAFAGRDFVLPEDVKKVAPYVLAHRIVSGSNLSADDSVKFIENIISAIPVPLENK
ncbi:MAG: MoxR family ATPase [Clostridia bacterium]|nr:MoxR family ATPase [Clostridia bacterium]MBQ2326182.1 MoxR family ATPase [Clostridia bacterium]